MDILAVVSGVLVGVGGLVVSVLAHRHQVRVAERLADREELVATRELEAEQKEALAQASRVHVAFVGHPARIPREWVLCLSNHSSQPLVDVVVRHDGHPVHLDLPMGSLRYLMPLSVRFGRIAPTDLEAKQLVTTVDFTDTAGRRWRRLGTGALQQRIAVHEDGTENWGRERAPLLDGEPPPFTWWLDQLALSAPPRAREPRAYWWADASWWADDDSGGGSGCGSGGCGGGAGAP